MDSPADRRVSEPDRHLDWLPGAFIALVSGAIYLSLRPPLYDNDGYRDRLYGLQSGWYYDASPHHLVWIPIQGGIARVASALGFPTTVPFQLVGIAISCGTLLLLFVLLRRACDNATFGAAGAGFVAMSPEFWHLGLQNRPYEFVFPVLVLYLLAWRTPSEAPPSGLRLIVAGLLVLLLALLQEAMVLLIPAGALALIACGDGTLARRLYRGTVWAGSILAPLSLLYLGAWKVRAPNAVPFLHWATKFAYLLHSPSLYDLGFAMCFVKACMGISGTLVQSAQTRHYLAGNLSSDVIFAIYASIGVLAMLSAVIWIWRRRMARPLLRMMRVNALFATSVLSIVFWAAFVFVWQPAEPHFWCAALFPALVCVGLVLRDRAWRGLGAFASIAFLVSALNGFLNVGHDRDYSRNFPEPLLAAIQQHVGPRDIFIVLSSGDWLEGMDYDLLFECLDYSPRNPGLAIVDYVAESGGENAPWQQRLQQKIESTLRSGGKVFVAGHLFKPGLYSDQTVDPFAIAIYKANSAEPGLYQQVQLVFAPYDLKASTFAIGLDKYFELVPKPDRGAIPPVGRFFDRLRTANVSEIGVLSVRKEASPSQPLAAFLE